jgi:hypothetical protein
MRNVRTTLGRSLPARSTTSVGDAAAAGGVQPRLRLHAPQREFLVPAVEARDGWAPVAERPRCSSGTPAYQVFDYPPVEGATAFLFFWRGAIETTFAAYLPDVRRRDGRLRLEFLMYTGRLLARQGFPFEPHGAAHEHPFATLLDDAASNRLRSVIGEVSQSRGFLLCGSAEDRRNDHRVVEPPPALDEILAAVE